MVYMTGKDFNEIMFSEYPDVVGLKDLTKMLGIGRNTALSLLQKQKIHNFKIGKVYKIPKKCVVEYVNSKIECNQPPSIK